MNSKRIAKVSAANAAYLDRRAQVPAPFQHIPETYLANQREIEAVVAMGRAYMAAGLAGANANVNHPMRAAWEAMRAYLVEAGQVK